MKISTVVIAKQEEQMIANCLESVRWCDEVLVVDNGSTDRTRELAERLGAKVHSLPTAGFIELRNEGMKRATGDWVFYLDADERVTPSLMKEIRAVTESQGYKGQNAFSVKRHNIHYGKWMQFGGWGEDRVIRLFRKSSFKQWEGEIHEHAEFEGETGVLHQQIIHLTHRDVLSGLKKTIEWTPIEADLFLNANHPPITTFRLLRVFLGAFVKRFFLQKGWKDGIEGFIEAFIQAVNRFYVYEQVWEGQRKPSLPEAYEKIEKDIHTLWKKDSK